jgi:serine/threonine protein kinase
MKRAKHPYIVHLNWTFQSEQKLYFVMEYLKGGDFAGLLDSIEGRCLTEEQAKFYAAQIYVAIQYLHENGVIYRDLKPENILLDEHGYACLSDFGLSKDFVLVGAGDHCKRADSFVGSPYYVAPDVLRHSKYCNKVDWWSFGVLLYRMLAGFNPFGGHNLRQVFDGILYGKQNYNLCPWVSADACSLINKLLEKEEYDRIAGEDVKNHPFFEGIDWEAVMNKTIALPKGHDRNLLLLRGKAPRGVDISPAFSPPGAAGIAASKQELFNGFTYVASLDRKLASSALAHGANLGRTASSTSINDTFSCATSPGSPSSPSSSLSLSLSLCYSRN